MINRNPVEMRLTIMSPEWPDDVIRTIRERFTDLVRERRHRQSGRLHVMLDHQTHRSMEQPFGASVLLNVNHHELYAHADGANPQEAAARLQDRVVRQLEQIAERRKWSRRHNSTAPLSRRSVIV